MTADEVRAELDHDPFIPFRLHLVSGKSFDVNDPGERWMLEHSILLMRRRKSGGSSYNVVSLFQIERLERLRDTWLGDDDVEKRG